VRGEAGPPGDARTPLKTRGTTLLRAQVGAGLARIFDRALLIGPLLMALAGLAAWTVGGRVWRLGPVSISLQRPLRSVGLAFALLLVRAAFQDRGGGRARAWTLEASGSRGRGDLCQDR
jgi:hypothetical protein